MEFRSIAIVLTRTWMVSIGVAVVCGSWCCAVVQAQDEVSDSRARIHFQAGRDHYDEGAYDQAYVEFQRAYDLSRRPEMLLNMASVLERLARHSEAADALEQYIAARPSDPARPTLERRIANLRRLASSFEPSAETPPPSVETDTPETEAVVVNTEIDGESAEATTPATGGSNGLLIGSIVGFTLAGLGLVTFGVFAALADDQYSTVRDRCGNAGTCTNADVADIHAFAALADAGWITALAGATVGTVALVVWLNEGGSNESSADSRIRLLPFASTESVGLFAHGNF